MSTVQKIIKYLAIAFAIALIFAIVGGILSALGALSFVFGDDEKSAGDVKNYDIKENITSLEIEIGAAALEIKEGDRTEVKSNLKNLNVEVKGSTLFITQETTFFTKVSEDAALTLTVPKGIEFNEADITSGAGQVIIEKLSAKEIELVLGAGEVIIEELSASYSCSIEGGAGKLSINGGSIKDLDLQLGVGEVNIENALKGDCEIDCGVGEANIRLLGNMEDYTVKMAKGIGDARVNGKEVSSNEKIGSGPNRIEINGGVGAVNVKIEN